MRTYRILSLIAGATCIVAAHAQAPQGFSYQAVARDSDGDAVMAQPIGVQFVLRQGNPLGAVVYAETHSATTNSNGLFALTVGGGAVGAGAFSSIDWSQGPYFLEVGLDVSSSGSYTNVGTQQLMSVPYALYAGKSNVPDGTEVGQILHWDGNAWVADPGLYVQGKRFGIGDMAPGSPLGIKGETGEDDKMISFTSDDESQKWNINLNPTGNDVDGFSIDDASSGSGSSRIFIAPVTGNVGLGTADPDAALTIRSDNPIKTHFQNGDVPTANDFWNMIDSYGLSTGQGNPDSAHIHLTLQSMTGHLGLGTNDPPAPLSIKTRETLKTYFETGDVPTESQFGIRTSGAGFDIGQGAPDALVSRLFIEAATGNVGVNTVQPGAPLAIKSRTDLYQEFQNGDIPDQNDFSFRTSGDPTNPGFSMEEESSLGHVSRLFIQGSSGYIGLGTTMPDEKLHIEASTPSGITGIKILNTATSNSQGWKTGVVHISATPTSEVRNGAFVVVEEGAPTTERMTILPGGNVGINEEIPDVRLHVSRPLSDPSSALDLLEGTGIVVVGPMTDNVVSDYRGIQARHGEYVGGGSTLSMTASELNLQRMGGPIVIHGDALSAPSSKGIFTADGSLGLGTITPTERIEIDGAIKIGNTDNPAPADGTIRYNGSDFEGRVTGDWVIFNGSAWEKVDNTESIYYNTGTAPRVGIGTNTPGATLHTRYQTQAAADEGAMAVVVENSGTTLSAAASATRVGLGINCTGAWSSNAQAKNVGLYVSEVSGQTEASSNIAAVLNGNVVVGDVTGQSVGSGGSHVLAIQSGAQPAAISGPPGAASPVQLYVTTDASGNSVLHVMNGNGDVMHLARQNALFTPNNDPVNPIYDASTAAVIENMRTRINELEAKLQAIGLLQ